MVSTFNSEKIYINSLYKLKNCLIMNINNERLKLKIKEGIKLWKIYQKK